MFKQKIIKKICLLLSCILIMLILYLFPKTDTINTYIPKTSYNVSNISDSLYVLDQNGYVSRIKIALKEANTDLKALEMIKYLTINEESSKILPEGFEGVIPEKTKVLDYKLDNNTLIINFSKELLNISKQNERKLIESLIYSLTSIKGIDNISILVNNNKLEKLPYSNEKLNDKLDKTYGINKEYDIDSIKDTTMTTVYYLSKNSSLEYYIPISKVTNDNSSKIEIIIKELTSSPTYETNLMSYLNSETTLKNYEILDKELSLDFNSEILSDVTKGDILEEVTYAINLSVKNNYDVEYVSYNVENKKIATFALKDLE